MSIASAIANKQQQVANCYVAVENKGGTLPVTQNVTNLPDAINSIPAGGGGGDKIFAQNRLGRTPITNEKVLVTKNTQTTDAISGSLGMGYYYTNSFINKNYIINPHSYDSYVMGYYYQNGSWVSARFNFNRYPDNRFPSIRKNNKVYYAVVNSSSFTCVDYEDLSVKFVEKPFMQLTDNLIYMGNNGKIYNNSQTQEYNTGMGDIRNSQKIFQMCDNYLVCFPNNQTLKVIDLSNFPSCTETIYNLPNDNHYFFGASGASIGDHIVTASDSVITILQITANGIIEARSINRLYEQYSNLTYDTGTKLLLGITADRYPFAYIIDKNTITELQIPANIRTNCHNDFVSANYDVSTRMGFCADLTLSRFCWSWSTGNYDNHTKVCQAKDDNIWYISEPILGNYENIGSFTGFITGEYDEQNNYEVLTILPKDYTITLDIDETPDEIDFIGAEVV